MPRAWSCAGSKTWAARPPLITIVSPLALTRSALGSKRRHCVPQVTSHLLRLGIVQGNALRRPQQPRSSVRVKGKRGHALTANRAGSRYELARFDVPDDHAMVARDGGCGRAIGTKRHLSYLACKLRHTVGRKLSTRDIPQHHAVRR